MKEKIGKVLWRMLCVRAPGALLGYVSVAAALHWNGYSLWWEVLIYAILTILLYAAFALQSPKFGALGEMMAEAVGTTRTDGFDAFHAALNPFHVAPLWHTPIAYCTAFPLVFFALGAIVFVEDYQSLDDDN